MCERARETELGYEMGRSEIWGVCHAQGGFRYLDFVVGHTDTRDAVSSQQPIANLHTASRFLHAYTPLSRMLTVNANVFYTRICISSARLQTCGEGGEADIMLIMDPSIMLIMDPYVENGPFDIMLIMDPSIL